MNYQVICEKRDKSGTPLFQNKPPTANGRHAHYPHILQGPHTPHLLLLRHHRNNNSLQIYPTHNLLEEGLLTLPVPGVGTGNALRATGSRGGHCTTWTCCTGALWDLKGPYFFFWGDVGQMGAGMGAGCWDPLQRSH